MYNVELSDGTKITGLKVNGSYFVSTIELNPEEISRKLSRVIVTTDEAEPLYTPGEYVNMKLSDYQKMQAPGIEPGYYFAIEPITAEEIAQEKIKADIEYIAMMNDIDLEG